MARVADAAYAPADPCGKNCALPIRRSRVAGSEKRDALPLGSRAPNRTLNNLVLDSRQIADSASCAVIIDDGIVVVGMEHEPENTGGRGEAPYNTEADLAAGLAPSSRRKRGDNATDNIVV